MIVNQVVRARRALLDALVALGAQKESVILVGAQAIYMHTGLAEIALAEFTTDGDLVIDSRTLVDDPLVEDAMEAGGFNHDPLNSNPGVWLSPDRVQIDLIVPAAIAGRGRRSVDSPPHGQRSMRKSYGLEAALVSNKSMKIVAFDSLDTREFHAKVAGPAALLVAKLHKLNERINERRVVDQKDAHDIYRLLVAIETETLIVEIRMLEGDPLSAEVTREALGFLLDLFGSARDPGSVMAGATEVGVGNPTLVSESVALLANDLASALRVLPS